MNFKVIKSKMYEIQLGKYLHNIMQIVRGFDKVCKSVHDSYKIVADQPGQ